MAASKIEKISSSLSARFNWRITNFSKLDAKAVSNVFSVGKYEWTACIYPEGREEVYDHLSLFLHTELGWLMQPVVSTKFSFAVTSQTDPNITVRKEVEHIFCNERESSFGWWKFMPLCELHDPAKGYIVDDTCGIGVEVTCRREEKEDKEEDQ